MRGRAGSIVKRCTKKSCRALVKERQCQRCAGRTFRWYFIVEVKNAGVRKREWSSGFPTRESADRALRERLGQQDRGINVTRAADSLDDFFGVWFATAMINLRPATADSYQRIWKRYVRDRIGATKIQDLTADDVQALYSTLLASGGTDGAPLSPNTVRHVHVIVSRMLDRAVKMDKVVRNVARLTEPPAQTRPADGELGVWSAAELATFERTAREDRLHALWLLLVTSGSRRGEALGMKWGDVDLDAGTWEIRRSLGVLNGSPAWTEPKTTRGRRRVALGSQTVAALRAHKKRQATEKMTLRGSYDDAGIVFCHQDGTALHPNVVTRWFYALSDRAGLPRIRLHDVRHSTITEMLRAGVPVKVVSERAGHASTAFTMDVYAAVLPDMQAAAAEQIESLLSGDVDSAGIVTAIAPNG